VGDPAEHDDDPDTIEQAQLGDQIGPATV